MSVEKYVYDLVKNNPKIKDFLKYTYQNLWGVFSKKKHSVLDEFFVRENSFFGFHDKSPWSMGNQSLLSHCFKGVGNEPCDKIDRVEICLFTGRNWVDKKVIGYTYAFNWQQGAQLQWLSENEILFNDFVDNSCVARIIDRSGTSLFNLPYSVGAVSPSSRKFAAYCFDAFGKAMPGYGYNFSSNNSCSTVRSLILMVGDIDNPENTMEIDCSALEESDFTG
jgi:hypothetical protein